MTKLALLISREEGFWRPGSIPALRHNPGDLRHSPHSLHTIQDPNAIGIIDTVADGWTDLERQLQIDAARGLTLEQAIYEWAPPCENPTTRYLADIVAGFGGAVRSDTPLRDVLTILV